MSMKNNQDQGTPSGTAPYHHLPAPGHAVDPDLMRPARSQAQVQQGILGSVGALVLRHAFLGSADEGGPHSQDCLAGVSRGSNGVRFSKTHDLTMKNGRGYWSSSHQSTPPKIDSSISATESTTTPDLVRHC